MKSNWIVKYLTYDDKVRIIEQFDCTQEEAEAKTWWLDDCYKLISIKPNVSF